MGAVICDSSALRYWRTPPLVRALVAEDPQAGGFPGVRQDELRELQLGVAREREIWREVALAAPRGRPVTSEAVDSLAWALDRLAPSLTCPVDVLVDRPGARRPSALVSPRVWSGPVPDGALVRIGEDVWVTSPAFTLLQLAARLSLPRLALVASELCGSFSVYECPEAVRELLERLHEEGRLARLSPWAPAFGRDGGLTEVWSRPPLVTPDELSRLVESDGLRGARGRRRLDRAARLVVPGAASPLEVRTAVLLGWPAGLGGEGLSGFSHNARVELSREARQVARRAACYCDLYWPGDGRAGALDLECQSGEFHASEASLLSDADRSTALKLMGVEVVEVTWATLSNEASLDALAGLVAERVGCARGARPADFAVRRAGLREEVLGRWGELDLRRGRPDSG